MNLLNIFKRSPKQPTVLSSGGRRSVIKEDDRFKYTFGYIRPTETGKWKYGTMNAKNIKEFAVSKILEILIENSDVLSLSVNTHKQKIVQTYDLISPEGDDEAVQIIRDFYTNIAESGDSIETVLSDFAYTAVVEGGVCGELFFTENGDDPLGIGVISPLSLIFPFIKDHPDYKNYYQVAQLDERGKHRILEDKGNPNIAVVNPDCFYYEPVNKIGNRPHGSSDLSPAIFSTLALKEMMDLLTQYARVQIFQRGVVFPDASDYISSEKYDDTGVIAEEIEKNTQNLNEQFSSSDVTQILFSNMKVDFKPLGNPTRANMDGADIVTRILERAQGRGAKLPRVIYNPDRTGSSLGANEAATEWQIFQQRLAYFRLPIEAMMLKFNRTILRHAGNINNVETKLDDTDYEGMLILGDVVKTYVESYVNTVRERIFTRQEVRSLLLRIGNIFKDIDAELPPELQGELPVNNPLPTGDPNEPEPTE